jgi:hypothetical protein
VHALPADHVGTAVLTPEGALFTGDADDLQHSLARKRIRFHRGRIGGAVPSLVT